MVAFPAQTPPRRRAFDLKQKHFAGGLSHSEVCELVDLVRLLDDQRAEADAAFHKLNTQARVGRRQFFVMNFALVVVSMVLIIEGVLRAYGH